MKPEFRLVRQTIYALKRIYPQRIELCRTSQNSTNYASGAISSSLTKVVIRKAILMPAKITRDFSYDLSFIAANKNFTYGAFYDKRVRMVLIDRRDLRRASPTFPVDLNMHVLFGGRRWEVKSLMEYEEQEVIGLLLEATDGASVMDDHVETVSESVTLTEEAEEDVE